MESKEDVAELESLFEKAATYVKSTAGTLSSENLLFLYSRFKQANEGPCNIPKPGFFDFQGKQKWEAWKSLGSMSREQAMTEYVDEVTDIDFDWEDKIDTGKVKASSGLGVGVSKMSSEETTLSDDQKTIFDWCIEGNVSQVSRLLPAQENINQKDSEGLALLHWACDRGLEDMVELLLRNKADANVKDADNQTPLHYASSCGHPAVVKILLNGGADVSLVDSEGQTALDLADSMEIKELLQQT